MALQGVDLQAKATQPVSVDGCCSFQAHGQGAGTASLLLHKPQLLNRLQTFTMGVAMIEAQRACCCAARWTGADAAVLAWTLWQTLRQRAKAQKRLKTKVCAAATSIARNNANNDGQPHRR